MLPLESRDRSCRRSFDRGPPKSEPCCFSKPSNASKLGRELLFFCCLERSKKNQKKTKSLELLKTNSQGPSMGEQ